MPPIHFSGTRYVTKENIYGAFKKEETEEKKRTSLDQNCGKAWWKVQCANRLGIRGDT